MSYIKGREQKEAILVSLDSMLSEDDLARSIDVFVNNLNIDRELFTISEAEKLAEIAFDPIDLLKLFIYCYLEDKISSRRIVEATQEWIPLMWLISMIRPDLQTIADFRRNNLKIIKSLYLRFVKYQSIMKLLKIKIIVKDGVLSGLDKLDSPDIPEKRLLTRLKRTEGKFDRQTKVILENDDYYILTEERCPADYMRGYIKEDDENPASTP